MQTPTFAELGLSAKVLAAIEATGYTTPTPIQAQAIPVAVTGRDVLGIAQTGTGKTAGFVLPMITRLETGRARARMPRSLILAPTRELAAQCAQSFERYGVNNKLAVALLIGGVSMDEQVQKLDRGVDVLIATPGRLLDHFGRGRIMLMGVEILVIDEADRMLDMGFIPDIEKICKLLPPRRQTLFFSATMPPEITRLTEQFLKDPARIEVAKPATTAKTITQRFRFCDEGEDWAKREVLRDLLRTLDVKNAIIFSNYKRDVAILLKSLTKHGFNAGALHGDMDQISRMATLDKFRSGEITLLAASDVAARGLDIPDVSHVINYDVPWQPEDYVHRIGRTGRAGKEGFSATIVTPADVKSMDAITKLIGEQPVWLGDAPDEDTLAEARSRKGRGRGRLASSRSARPARNGGRGRPGAERPAARSHRRDGETERPSHRSAETRTSERSQWRPGAEGAEPRARRAEPIREQRPPRDERAPREAREWRDAPRDMRPQDEFEERQRDRDTYGRDEAPRAPERRARDEERAPRREREPERSREREQPSQRALERDRPSHHRSPERERAPERERTPERARERTPERERERPSHRAAERQPVVEFHGEHDEMSRLPRSRRPQRPAPERETAPARERRDEGRASARSLQERAPARHPADERSRDRGRDAPRDRAPSRERAAETPRGQGGARQSVGLGDHVPAFLRRPVRAGLD